MDVKQQLASYLLQIKAFQFAANGQFFTWASGLKSPVYTDNRRLVSYPLLRDFIVERFIEIIRKQYPFVQYIAAVATGAITYGAIVADRLGLPFVYVRPKPKTHGLQNQVEGFLSSGVSVIVIEDLISTGGSSITAVDALQNSGAEVVGVLAVFSYNLQIAKENFKNKNISLHTLTDIDAVLEEAGRLKVLNSAQIKQILNWEKTVKL